MRAEQIDINWHPGLSIYASEQYLKAVGDEYGWLGGIDDSGKLRCILPYSIIRKAIFRLVRFRVETISLDNELTIQDEKFFLNRAMDFFRSIGADMVIPATTNTIFRTCPDGADVAPYGSYINDLTQPEEVLWQNMNSSHRRNIRHAEKEGVRIRESLDKLQPVYELIRDTFRRSKIPFMSYRSFIRLVNQLHDYIRIYTAEYNGSIQGCIVVPYSKHSAYYVYGGSIPTPLKGANNLLHWQAMKEFKNLGVNRYDFVGVRINPEKGSKQEGLLTFKKRFGGQLAQGYMWKYPLHRLKYAAYAMAVRVQRGGDIVDVERHKLHAE